MDLRSYITSPLQISKAKELVLREAINYQPFLFADDFETGIGFEFLFGEFKGMVHSPDFDRDPGIPPAFRRFLIAAEDKENFSDSNRRLRVMYEGFVDAICGHFGDVSHMTFADIGCNSGYFPLSFSRRGAAESVGYDRVNYTGSFDLLNDILGTRARFIHSFYRSTLQKIPDCTARYDVVTTTALLCHLPDPLQYLAFLGSMARKALFIWTGVSREDEYCIGFGEPNKYYKSDAFPLCFDNLTTPSLKLLLKSLELMGFTEIHQIANPPGGMPDSFFAPHAAILAIRER